MPIFFFIYYLTPDRFKNAVLFAGSIVFYAFGEPKYIILIMLSVVVNYLSARFMCRFEDDSPIRMSVMLFTIIFDLLILIIFKYTGFILNNINAALHLNIEVPSLTLPLGISFYTFQIMSYIIDVYTGKSWCEESFINLGTYIMMFPQLIAGPIVMYGDVEDALKSRHIRLKHIENGLKTFTVGLGAKVLLANNLGQIWQACDEVGYANISTPFAWLGIISYSMQLYFDFNGYSLMAIGLGEMLGFSFPENFNHPYTARSCSEFWHRWHMTLTGWFREYIYIPMGGSRAGAVRTYLNMLVVWLMTGLWHGADWSFIIWGLYYFVLLSVERLFLKRLLERAYVLPHLYTLLAVICGWVLFATSSIEKAGIYFSRMFIWHSGDDYLEYLINFSPVLIAGVLFCTPLFAEPYREYKRGLIVIGALTIVFWISVALLVNSVYNPFLYFRF